ncbi:MAG: hypothetical protein JXA52_00755 [Planctomycetes bacterium]|nr:hypothetical protein [Planctomycetota bacterium]
MRIVNRLRTDTVTVKSWLVAGCCLGAILISGCGLEKPFGGPSESSALPVSTRAMQHYLEDAELNTPQILSGATGRIQKGEIYRERVRDQRSRWTLATIWMDPDQARLLHIQTKRAEECPDCKGSGKVKGPLNLDVDFICKRCQGDGVIDNFVQEKKYILSDADLNPNLLGKLGGNGSPREIKVEPLTPEEEKYIAALPSDDPQTRLDALIWLDRNYLSPDKFFTSFMPMLRKAKWIEKSESKNLTLYQFWAARESKPEMSDYRVYIDNKSGKIKDKGFVNIDGFDPSQEPGSLDKMNDTVDAVKDWFRWEKE